MHNEENLITGISRSISLVVVFTIVAKFLGFFREVLLAYYFGATGISDAYLVSQTIPGTIFQIVGTGLTTCFIPVFFKVKREKGLDCSYGFVSTLLTLTLLFSLVANLLVFFNTSTVVSLFAPGFSDEVKDYAIIFTRINMVSLFFSSFLYVYISLLQANNDFKTVVFSGIPYNICLVMAIYAGAKFNIYLLSLFSSLAVLIQLLFLLRASHSLGFRYRISFDFGCDEVRHFVKLLGPVILGVSVSELNILIDRSLASKIVTGGISSLVYANSLVQLVIGGVVQPVVTVCYPKITESVTERDFTGAKVVLSRYLYVLLGILLPITIIFVVYGQPIVKLLFNHGVFDDKATLATSQAVRWYSIGICFVGFQEFLSRFFYAHSDTKTPMIVASVSVVTNIVLNIILSRLIGLKGLALSTSISAMVGFFLLYYLGDRKLRGGAIRFEFARVSKIVFASIVSIIPVYFFSKLLQMKNDFFFIIEILMYFSFYYLVGGVLKLEIVQFVSSLKKGKP